MNNIAQNQNSPWLSLVILLGLTIGCAIGAQLLVVLLDVLLKGGAGSLSDSLIMDFKTNPAFSYAMVISSSFGTFLLPAWFLQRIEPYHSYFPTQRRDLGLFVVLSVLFLVAFVPVMNLVGDLNMKMSLPESMSSLEAWMKEKEDSMAQLTQNMVMVDSWGFMLVNIVALAVMPAIAEEYYFRGAVMFNIQRIMKNHHLAIWVTAIIFSAIHVQFFGFFPRVLLGAFFGYMLLWTQNIWVPIIGHFVNNAGVVIIAFYYTKQGKTYEELQASEGYSIFLYLGSFILSGVIGWYFYTKSKQINSSDGKGLD